MMRRTLALAICGMLLVPAAFGQVVTPVLPLPPCTGQGCLNKHQGATITPPARQSAKRTSCPQGTVYDPVKGTCRVMPVH